MARSKKDPPDQKNPTDKKARKRLERVDHHMHPAQGKLPYSGRWHRHQHHAYGAWHPFAMAPGALSTRAAGESGFTTGDGQLGQGDGAAGCRQGWVASELA